MIVLSGKKRSGKDTAAAIMREEGMKTYALADPIKVALFGAFQNNRRHMTFDALNGIDTDREAVLPLDTNTIRLILVDAVMHEIHQMEIVDSVKVLNNVLPVIAEQMAPFSIRKFMQVFGTDIMCMNVSKKHWLAYTKDLSEDTVITDCRQPWEEEFFREKNSDFVFIEGAYPGFKESTDNHITELGLTPKDGDKVVINKDITEFTKEIKEYVRTRTTG